MKRVVKNFKFLKRCTRSTVKTFSDTIKRAKKEEIKAVVECVFNTKLRSSSSQLIGKLKSCKTLKEIRKLLWLNHREVKSCIAIILSEILTCAVRNIENASDNESNSS
ncbi:unnamed protein product [Orchesella dallaii]|uniref:Uncharacterized protein n=1 Tax=Orchesella dallaii TaxID=48710 RepID=A0ABP1RH72_9HEXA